MAPFFYDTIFFSDIYFDAFINGVWYEKSREMLYALNSYIMYNVFLFTFSHKQHFRQGTKVLDHHLSSKVPNYCPELSKCSIYRQELMSRSDFSSQDASRIFVCIYLQHLFQDMFGLGSIDQKENKSRW